MRIKLLEGVPVAFANTSSNPTVALYSPGEPLYRLLLTALGTSRQQNHEPVAVPAEV